MAAHSNTQTWKIPWTEDRDWLQYMGLQRVRHNWVTSLSFKCLGDFLDHTAKKATYKKWFIYLCPILLNTFSQQLEMYKKKRRWGRRGWWKFFIFWSTDFQIWQILESVTTGKTLYWLCYCSTVLLFDFWLFILLSNKNCYIAKSHHHDFFCLRVSKIVSIWNNSPLQCKNDFTPNLKLIVWNFQTLKHFQYFFLDPNLG